MQLVHEAQRPPLVFGDEVRRCVARRGGMRDGARGRSGARIPSGIFVPTQVAGCVLWLRADMGVTVNGSTKVTTWADQSGAGDTGRNFAPRGTDLVAWNASDAGYNGQATIGTFNQAGTANDSGLKSGTWSASYATPFILIVGNVPDAGIRYFSNESTTDYLSLSCEGGNSRARSGTSTTLLSAAISVQSAPSLIAAHWNGASSSLFVNALTAASVTGTLAATTLGDAPYYLGSYPLAATTYGVDRIAEVIVYSSLPSAGDRALLRSYLNARYGAAWS